jgi:hypothetical protein
MRAPLESAFVEGMTGMNGRPHPASAGPIT